MAEEILLADASFVSFTGGTPSNAVIRSPVSGTLVADAVIVRRSVTADAWFRPSPEQIPSFRSNGSFLVGSGTLGLPSGWQVNDVLVITWAHRSSGYPEAPPSGWEEIGRATTSGSNSPKVQMFWKRAVSGQTAPTLPNVGNACAQMAAFKDCVLTGQPYEAVVSGADNTVNTSFNANGTTTLGTNRLVVLGLSRGGDFTGAVFSNPSWAVASGAFVTERQDNGTAVGLGTGLAMASMDLFDPGATGAWSATSSLNANEAYVVFALLPTLSITANAVIRKPDLSGSFTANALFVSFIGSRTAEAIVRRPGIAASVNANAIIQSVVGGRRLPQYISVGTQPAGTGNTGGNVIPKPAGTEQGDLLIATMTGADPASDEPDAPAGWTPVQIQDTTAITLAVWYKFAGASEPSTYTFAVMGFGTGSIMAFRGAEAISDSGKFLDPAADVISGPSLSLSGNYSGAVLVASVGWHRAAGLIATAPGFTIRAQVVGSYVGPDGSKTSQAVNTKPIVSGTTGSVGPFDVYGTSMASAIIDLIIVGLPGFSADAYFILGNPIFTADAYILKVNPVTADAIIGDTFGGASGEIAFFAEAWIFDPDTVVSTFYGDAVIANNTLWVHDRETWHTGIDTDLDNVLAAGLGYTLRGDPLAELLAEIDARLTAKEAGRLYRKVYLTANAVLHDTSAAITANALLAGSQSKTFTARALLRAAIRADAITRKVFTASITGDAEIT